MRDANDEPSKEKKAYLGIIDLAWTEQGLERVVARNKEAGKVHKELPSNIEEYQEEVNADKAEEGIDFGNRTLLL